MTLLALLRKEMIYDQATGVFTWARTRGGKLAGTIAGSEKDGGYWVVGLGGKIHLAHRLAWLYVTGSLPKAAIDHKNGDRSDNRFSNLREATWSQNNQNRAIPLTNKSGFIGVCWHKVSEKWVAQFSVGGVRKHLGTFDTAEAAYAVYLAAKAQHHTFQPVPRYEAVSA